MNSFENFVTGINEKLYECQLFDQSLNSLMLSFNELKKKGGDIILSIRPNTGKALTQINLSEETTFEVLKTIITIYNERLENMKQEIIQQIEGEKRNV